MSKNKIKEQQNENGIEPKPEQPPVQEKTWPVFIYEKATSEKDITVRLINEIKSILTKNAETLSEYFLLYLYDTRFKISPFASERIYTALSAVQKKQKNVLLMITSSGGSIEPAYQLSKICSEFSKEKFVVVVPRAAKSAATLICLGANEIHMGMLSELGPIDPQIDGRPVLGLSYSLV